jgi:uncharacterized RDD family membrane protein YckC
MSWPPREGDPTPANATPPSDSAVPETEPALSEPAPTPTTEPPPSPATGIISAQPVGMAGPPAAPPGAPSDRPLVYWEQPTAPVALPGADGLVIAGVFSRLVAYGVDVLFLGSISLATSGALGMLTERRDSGASLIVGAIFVAVDLLYFVGLWTSGWHGTLGMRLMRLRILGVVSARTISVNDAILRWLALSGTVSILTLVPDIGPTVGVLSLVWLAVLLVTTTGSPLHQGLHDRWARSVVVQPAPGGSGAAAVTCLVLLVILFVVLPLLLLAVAGDQLRDILSQIGSSV